MTAGIAVAAVPSPGRPPLLTEVPFHHEPVLLLPHSPLLLLFPGLLRCPRTRLFSLVCHLMCALVFPCLFLRPLGLPPQPAVWPLWPLSFSATAIWPSNSSRALLSSWAVGMGGGGSGKRSKNFFMSPAYSMPAIYPVPTKLCYAKSRRARSGRGILLHSMQHRNSDPHIPTTQAHSKIFHHVSRPSTNLSFRFRNSAS